MRFIETLPNLTSDDYQINPPLEVSSEDALIINLVMICGINLPWTLSCVRSYIVIPDTRPTRLFAIVYDTVITKAFFRNHVILLWCSTQVGGWTA